MKLNPCEYPWPSISGVRNWGFHQMKCTRYMTVLRNVKPISLLSLWFLQMNWIPYEHYVWYFEIEMVIKYSKIYPNITERYLLSLLCFFFFEFYFEKFEQTLLFFKIFHWRIFVKKHEITFQTIMLLFLFFDF